jgi:hypothetical protein
LLFLNAKKVSAKLKVCQPLGRWNAVHGSVTGS